MLKKFIPFLCAIVFSTTAAHAAPPSVVTTINPVYALVTSVMGEIGKPQRLLDASASPHAFALKPAQAAMLENADVVFWIGPGLETTLEKPLLTLSANARVVSLMDAPGLNLLHSGEAHGHDGHAHGDADPHIWLSPDNARALIDFIEAELSKANPGNAAIFAKNAKRAKNRIANLKKMMGRYLDHTKDVAFIVQHDSYGYFARDFGLNLVGHLQLTPGREAGAKHLSEMRQRIKDQNVVCLFADAQASSPQVEQLAKELGLRLGELDPMGMHLDVSETLYVRIIQQLALSLDQCLYTKPKD